jgi:hypothetical protein
MGVCVCVSVNKSHVYIYNKLTPQSGGYGGIAFYKYSQKARQY